MRSRVIPALIAGLLLAACGDDTTTGGGGTGGTGGETPEGGGGQQSTGGGGQSAGGGGQTAGGGGEGGGVVGPVCGDGTPEGTEECDDANTTAGDGCDDACAVEDGFSCDGTPSVCTTSCGDGIPAGDEECDDANTDNVDGCSSMCETENGYDCTGEPSVCTADCGDGLIADGAEECDDANTDSDDGCDSTCAIEAGWACDMEPSVCTSNCGDGIIAGMEGCDDAANTDGDGCSATCAEETGWGCTGEPSVCALSGSCADPIQVTGDGFVWQVADLLPYGDDLDLEDVSCVTDSSEPSGKPDAVFSVDLEAGDTLHVAESGTADVLMHVISGACDSATACDESFDGIGATEITPGLLFNAPTTGTYTVVVDSYAVPAAGETIDLLFEISPCGDGVLGTGEACDDGDTTGGDGCSATCTVEVGYACTGEPSVCTLLPGLDCGSPIVATDGFTYTGSNIAAFGDDENFADVSCRDVDGTPNASPDILFSVALTAGQRLNVQDHGTVDTVVQITQGTCGAGVCVANFDDPDTTGPIYVAPATDTYYVAVESYFSNPAAAQTFDIRFEIATCGDGAVELGEACDDDDLDPNDGCSATCTVEAGYLCTGSPSVCTGTPAANCANPILVTSDAFTFAGTNINQFGDDQNYNAGTGCVDVSTTPPSGFDVVFRVDALAGERIRLRELGTLDAVFHIFTQPQCGAGVPCAASADFNETTGITYVAPAAGPVYLAVESYGNPGATTTYDVRIDRELCGDAVLGFSEACDDGNLTAGDGCTATCTTEPGYTCSGSPSVCVGPELNCSDGIDNNGANGIDAADPSCAVPAYFPACGGGQTLWVIPSGSINLPIVDNTPPGAVSTLAVAAAGTIAKAAIVYNITHTWDSDVDVFLTAPGGGELDMCTDNGTNGDNYVNTVLDSTCVNPVTGGTAPFTNCYTPETSLAGLVGTNPAGNWTLRAVDDEAGAAGTLQNWSLVLCTN